MDALALDIEKHLIRQVEQLAELLNREAPDEWLDAIPAVAEREAERLASEEHSVALSAAYSLYGLVDVKDPEQARTPLAIRLVLVLHELRPISRDEAAWLLRVSRNQVHNLVAAGLLETAAKRSEVLWGSVARRLDTVQPRRYRSAPTD